MWVWLLYLYWAPKKATATRPSPSTCEEKAAPIAIPKLPPTIAVAPRMPLLGSANRDPKKYKDADRLELDRNPKEAEAPGAMAAL